MRHCCNDLFSNIKLYAFLLLLFLLRATLKEKKSNNNNEHKGNVDLQHSFTWSKLKIPNHLIISEPTVILSDQSINFAGDPSRSNYKKAGLQEYIQNIYKYKKIHLAWLFYFSSTYP